MADEYAQVQRHLEAKGLRITTGTIVDTTAPSSTKNPPRRAKGNQWYFGLKAHFGVDSCSKLIHAALVTSANVADSATGLSLPAGGDPAQAPKGSGLHQPPLSSPRRGGRERACGEPRQVKGPGQS
jgi:IS5 family transposase